MGTIERIKMTEDDLESQEPLKEKYPLLKLNLDTATPEQIEKAIRKAALDAGVTNDFLIKYHKELLDFENPTIVLKALELFYKIKGLLTDKVELSGQVNISESLKSARTRLNSYGNNN